MYRAEFKFRFPTEDIMEPNPPIQLGEFFTEQPNIWKALDEARLKRRPIASALIQAFPTLPYVKCEDIEIHLQQFDPQIGLFGSEELHEKGGKAVAKGMKS